MEPQPAIRDTLGLSMLSHVPFDGWSRTALRAALSDAGLPMAAAQAAFPGELRDLAVWFGDYADRRMREALDERTDLGDMGMTARLALALRCRLDLLEAHREAAGACVAWLARGAHAMTATRMNLATADAAWTAVGDTSQGIDAVTRRAMLAPVHGATLLFWLNDDDPQRTATWRFLDKRLKDALRVGRLGARFTGPLRAASQRLRSGAARRG